MDFPEGEKFQVGEGLDLGEDGSWRVKAIEAKPLEQALPRLILARTKR
jgi:hypothetical protein